MRPGAEPPKRRRFLTLRILFFLLSLPLAWWAATRYGATAWSYAQTYPRLTGFWFWFWTVLLLWGTWGIWRLLRRKAARARELARELDAPRR
ncbi:MAG: hypothetical protein RL291_2057 [Pseudomonadota bacterium]|jgi:hypothetical protein